MRLALRVRLALCALAVVCWKLPAFGVALDTEGDIKLGARVYTAARLGTEHTDIPNTFPYSPAGHLRQHRTFIEAEFDHDLIALASRDGFAPLSFLKELPIEVSRLKYHLTYRGEMEGIYDYGPTEYRTANQFQSLPHAALIDPDTCPPGPDFEACANGLQQEFIGEKRRTLRARATQRHRLFQAFIDTQVGDLFIRFGRQILSWGETDNFRVLDNINPLDSSFGGFLVSLDERRVPLDMVRANYFLGSLGPFSEMYLEGFAVFDNEWGGYPGIPQGSPWQLPNLGRPNANLITFTVKPATNVENTRGGGQLKFNIDIPAIGDATFGVAHYYTYFDLPALQLTAAAPLIDGGTPENGLIANPVNLYPDGSAVHAIQTAQRVQITGASSTFVIPSKYARKIFLGGEPVIRTELAYFHREPRYRQSEVDPFFFAVAQPGQPLPPNEEVIGKRRVGDSWNFVLGMDMNQFIRWLNPQNSFFFSTQFFYKHLNGAVKRGAFSYNQLGTTQPVAEGEVLPVPESTNFLGAPLFVHNPADQYLQTLFIATSYAGGQVIPSMTFLYDWFGSFVAIPSVTLSRDPFRFTLQYNFLNASRLRGASGTSLLRDRDNVLFQLEYVL
jgi:hypothetical protein